MKEPLEQTVSEVIYRLDEALEAEAPYEDSNYAYPYLCGYYQSAIKEAIKKLEEALQDDS